MTKKKTKTKSKWGKGQTTRVLNQDEIDSLLGFDPEEAELLEKTEDLRNAMASYILFIEMYLRLNNLDPTGFRYQSGKHYSDIFDYTSLVEYLKEQCGILDSKKYLDGAEDLFKGMTKLTPNSETAGE